MNINGNFLSFNSEEDDKVRFSTLPTLKKGDFLTVAPQTVKGTQYVRIAANVSSKPQNDFDNADGKAFLAAPSVLDQIANYEYRNLPNYLGKCYEVVKATYGDKVRRSDSTLYKAWIYELKEAAKKK